MDNVAQMVMNTRRKFIKGVSALAATAGVSSLRAQPATASTLSFPSKPIRIVVPYAVGGPSDTVTRVIAQRMSAFLNTSVIVENKAGANALIGMEHVARQPGDGYTLVMFSQGGSVLNTAARGNKMPYDLLKDFRAVGNMAVMPQICAGSNNVPCRTLSEFVTYAKANPGKLSYGSSGPGSTPHLTSEWMKLLAGIEMTHVPYKGTGPATVDLIAGHIQMVYTEAPVLLEHIRDGKIRALAVSTKNRLPYLPNVPTVAESGFPQITGANWFGLQVPSSTPTAIVNVLNDALNKSLEDPAIKATLIAQGAEPDPGPPAKFDQFVRDELTRWQAMIKVTKVKLT